MSGSQKTLTVERITCVSAVSSNNREIISVAGMPFYQSTGHNSAYPNTWFPFFGVQQNNTAGAYPRGWFIKSFASDLPKHITNKMDELFPSYGGCDAGRELQSRFWNVPSLLFSSTLGGGLWDSEKGVELKAFLAKTYPQYYKEVPKVEQTPSLHSMAEPEAVNQWLCTKAGLTDYKQLSQQFPKTADDFLKKVIPLAKKPEPAFVPPIPMLRDPLKELPHYVGQILAAQQSKTAPKAAPIIAANKAVPKAPIKVTTKKVAERAAPKKSAPKRVKIASLDTQNGKRLFEVRNQLKNLGKKPAPKRADHEKPLQRFLKKLPETKVVAAQPSLAAKPERRFFSFSALAFGMLTAAVYFAFGFSSMMALSLGLICYVGTMALQFSPTTSESAIKAPSLKTPLQNQSQEPATKAWLPSQNHNTMRVLQEQKPAPRSILKTRMGL